MKGYASKASEAGKNIKYLKLQLNSIFEVAGKEANNITNEQAVNIVLDPAKKGIYKTITEKSEPFQKNFIKYLVMHPGTTALNIKGWIQASGMQSYTDMLRGQVFTWSC